MQNWVVWQLKIFFQNFHPYIRKGFPLMIQFFSGSHNFSTWEKKPTQLALQVDTVGDGEVDDFSENFFTVVPRTPVVCLFFRPFFSGRITNPYAFGNCIQNCIVG